MQRRGGGREVVQGVKQQEQESAGNDFVTGKQTVNIHAGKMDTLYFCIVGRKEQKTTK